MKRTAKHVPRTTALLILTTAFLMWVADPSIAVACENCFGARVDTPETRGIALAMLLLVGMTGVVWGGIGAFFLHLRRRARMLEPGEMVVTETGEISQGGSEMD